MDKVRLIAPKGTDECNYRGERYRVDNDGIVEVDAAAVAPLLATGGFALADPVPPVAVAHGTVELVHRSDPVAEATVAGVTYVPDASGIIRVPVEQVDTLKAHGFDPVPKRL
jgi:hypothetical protein